MRPRTALVLLCGLLWAAPCPGGQPPPPRVLALLGEDFFASEYWEPYYALTAAGYRVDPAGAKAGTVRSALPCPDAAALEDVKADDYLGLFVPGGKGPENLEKHPRAAELCREFRAAGKVVGAICHGPRLLLSAGAIGRQVHTVLWVVKDELPAAWRDPARGPYVDEAAVVDGNLVTSRCPWDAVAFARAMLGRLHAAGGPAPPELPLRVAAVAGGAEPHLRMALLTGGLPALGAEVRAVEAGELAAFAAQAKPQQWHALIVLPGEALKQEGPRAAAGRLAAAFAAAGRSVLLVGEAAGAVQVEGAVRVPAEPAGALREAVGHLQQCVPPPEPAAPPAPRRAVLALAEGFDDQVAAAMLAWLAARDERVLVLAERAGWVRGLNGTAIRAAAAYGGHPPVARDALIVLPGAAWPREQGEGADPRVAWALARHGEGARLVAFGLDCLALARGGKDLVRDREVAGSDQTWWALRDLGARFALGAETAQTGERLITARGFSSVPRVWAMLSPAR